MKSRTPVTLAVFAVLTASSFAQTQRSALSVRIQATFRAADVNKNGTISIREAAAAGIPPVSFATHDLNKDRRLSSDEFEDYYQRLLVVRRQEQAQRLADNAAKRAGRDKKPLGEPAKPVPVVTPKVDVLPGKPTGKIVDHTPATDGPVSPAPVLIDPLGSGVLEPKPLVDGKPGEPGKIKKGAKGDPFVSELQSKGKLSAVDAKAVQLALSLPASGKDAAANFVEWRSALNNARERIGALVLAKAMTAEDGRELYQLLELRAQEAVRLQQEAGVATVVMPGLDGEAQMASKEKDTESVPGKPTSAKASENGGLNTPAVASDENVAAAERAHNEQRIKDARARLAEQQAKDQAVKDQAAKVSAEGIPAAKDQAVKDQAAKDQAVKDQAAKDQAVKDQAVKDQAAKDQAARDQRMKDIEAKKRAQEASKGKSDQKPVPKAEPSPRRSKPNPQVKGADSKARGTTESDVKSDAKKKPAGDTKH